jgi:hypothetical protein
MMSVRLGGVGSVERGAGEQKGHRMAGFPLMLALAVNIGVEE